MLNGELWACSISKCLVVPSLQSPHTFLLDSRQHHAGGTARASKHADAITGGQKSNKDCKQNDLNVAIGKKKKLDLLCRLVKQPCRL